MGVCVCNLSSTLLALHCDRTKLKSNNALANYLSLARRISPLLLVLNSITGASACANVTSIFSFGVVLFTTRRSRFSLSLSGCPKAELDRSSSLLMLIIFFVFSFSLRTYMQVDTYTLVVAPVVHCACLSASHPHLCMLYSMIS